jgi:hypothetical protein
MLGRDARQFKLSKILQKEIPSVDDLLEWGYEKILK